MLRRVWRAARRPPVAARRRALGGAAGQQEVRLTESCARRIKEIAAGRGADTALRVVVESGGCSGFQYKFKLEAPPEPARDDRAFDMDGARVLVDEVSLDFLRGATIDYEREMVRSHFAVIDNPNTEDGCGCGVSFSAKAF